MTTVLIEEYAILRIAINTYWKRHAALKASWPWRHRS